MSPRIRRPDVLHALLLAACLLAAQWVGVGHRVEHGAFIGARATAPHAHDRSGLPAIHARSGLPVHAAQDGHEGHAPDSAQCLLIDHALAQADAWLPALAPAFTAQPQVGPEPKAAAAVRTAAVVPYLARGPPQARA